MFCNRLEKNNCETIFRQCLINDYTGESPEPPLETMPGSKWKLRRDPWAKFLHLDEDGNYQEDI